MLKKIKDIMTGKFFFLFLIVFFLFVSAETVYSQSIRLVIPNGGETWIIGQEKYISWISNGLSADTKVELGLFQKRKRIGTIASNRSIRPGEAVAWKWKVGQYQGGTATPGSGYKVCIHTLDEPYRFDCSDHFFALRVTGSIIVTSPRSETVWYNENTYNITWEGGALSPYLKISLLDQHGRFIRRLFSTVFNDGTQPWKVPKDIRKGTYIILIQTQAGFGYKSEPFKIVRVFKKRPPDFEKKEPEELPIVK